MAQAPAQNQPPAKPAGQMDVMDMGKDKAAGKSLGMCKCQCMSQGKTTEMDMDMGKCMSMGQGKTMEMGKGIDHEMKMGGMEMGKPAVPAGPLKIIFSDKTAEWTPAALVALSHKTVTVFDEHAKANQSYSGVPLMELLTRLGVPDKPHGTYLRFYLVVEGADGFKAVYSLAEVNPMTHDGAVIVADTLDGKALQTTGPLQLVASGDKHPARWVRNLSAIRVLALE